MTESDSVKLRRGKAGGRGESGDGAQCAMNLAVDFQQESLKKCQALWGRSYDHSRRRLNPLLDSYDVE